MSYRESNSLDKYKALKPAQRKLVLSVLNEAALKFKRKVRPFSGTAPRGQSYDDVRECWQAMHAAEELLRAVGYLVLKRRKGKTEAQSKLLAAKRTKLKAAVERAARSLADFEYKDVHRE